MHLTWLLTWFFFNSTQLAELSQLSTSLRFLQTATFWSTKYPYYHHMTRYVTSSVHTEHFPPINLVVSSKLAVYNSKSIKPNGSARPFRRKNLFTFKSFHPASLMAWSFTCRSLCQNPPFDGKNKLASGTPTKGSNRCTPTTAATCVFIPAVAPIVALLAASGSANSFMARELENDL